MRMRLKKYLDERMQAVEDYIVIGYSQDLDARNTTPTSVLDLRQIFGNDNPVALELGCGKGQWICRMALAHPDVNYIAVENVTNVIVTACEKAKDAGLTNVRFANCGVEYLPRHLPKGAFDTIYLNFSSPYPKNQYENRRLTNARYLALYRDWLREGGEIRQKTDNRPFFEYSLVSMSRNGLRFKQISCDLHKDTDIANLTSEYEDRFSPFGPIYFVVAEYVRDGE